MGKLLPNGVKLRLSPTKLKVWEECPMRFRNLILEGDSNFQNIHSITGTAAHHVLEMINRGLDKDGDIIWSPERRVKEFKEKILALCSDHEVPYNLTPAFRETSETLRYYQWPKGYRPLYTEEKQVLEFEDFDFSYIPDIIFERDADGAIFFKDYKTSAKAPKTAVQLKAYGWATVKKHPHLLGRPLRLAFHMLRKDQFVYHEMTAEDIEAFDAWMLRQVDLMHKSFVVDYFDRRKNEECRYCQVKECHIRDAVKEEE